MNKLFLTEDNMKDVLNELIKRSPNHYGEFEKIVSDIISDIKQRKDEAVFEYTLKFDKFALNADNIRVTEEEIEEAVKEISPEYYAVMEEADANIKAFHEMQVRQYFIQTEAHGSI